ncbi:thermonuclease family protein [Bartonella senegalensis]|uniref:thermonuclease family protein n=1 Tax=Bartonella senegalensis TaxID=1468418 RepID=UPI0002F1001F|nr:thermonuclease family protein [Bartonella senegalensis]
MKFLGEYVKRMRFKLIIILYIVGSIVWGVSQYKDKIDFSFLMPLKMQEIQDIVEMHWEEKKPTGSLPKQQFIKNEPVFNLQKSVSPDNAVVFYGRASVTSGVTFKLITPVAQSWRKHITRNIHLYGVDTCATRQKAKLNDQEWPCGAVTTAWLVTKTLGQDLSCKQAVMRNGISYAQCFVQGVDLAEAGLAEGMLVLSKEDKNPAPAHYRSVEDAARNNKVGLWSSDFTEPLQWRKDHGAYNPFASF